MDRIINGEKNDIEENDDEITNSELENNITTLQNAINIVKSQRKQTEQETKIILLKRLINNNQKKDILL